MAKKIIPGEITEADVKYVSLVGKAANRQTISIYKEEDADDEVCKTEQNAELGAETDGEVFKNTENEALETAKSSNSDEMKRLPEDGTSEEKSFLRHVMAFFKKEHDVEKAENVQSFNSRVNTREMGNTLYLATDAFMDTIRNIVENEEIEDKASEYQKAIKEFSDYMTKKLVNQSIEKNDAFFNAESEDEMKVEDIKKMIDETIAPLKEAVDAMKAEETKDEVEQVEKSDELTVEKMQEIVKSAIEPLAKDIDTLKKVRGLAKSEEGNEAEKIEKQEETDLFANWL